MIYEEIRNYRFRFIRIIRNLSRIYGCKSICSTKIQCAVRPFHGGQRIIHLSLCVFSFIKPCQMILCYIITIQTVVCPHPYISCIIAQRINGINILLQYILHAHKLQGACIKFHKSIGIICLRLKNFSVWIC